MIKNWEQVKPKEIKPLFDTWRLLGPDMSCPNRQGEENFHSNKCL